MKKIYFSLIFIVFAFAVSAQISVTSTGTAFTEDFNTLANTGTSSTVPAGWAFLEAGSAGNTTYTASAGSSTADTYSFGTGTFSDRAFGGFQSNNLNPTIGVSYINNTGSAITSISVTYTGEEWYLGVAARTDRMAFQYSTNATSLSTGAWNAVTPLDFITPNTAGVGAKDGNAAGNRTPITSTITGINIPAGAIFWFRWQDINISGVDDGLGIDDYSATFFGGASVPCTEPAAQPTALTLPTVTSNAVSGSFTAAAADGYLVIRTTSAALSAAPADGVTYAAGTAYGSGISVSNNSAVTFTDNGLTPSTQYFYFIYAYNNSGCTGGPNYNASAPLQGNATTLAPPTCTTPNAPTLLNLAPSNNSVNGNFTGSGASSYVVIMSTSSSLGTNLLNGNTYPNGTVVGTGTVIANTTGTTFSVSGLTVATQYFFFIYAANTGCTGAPTYSVLSLDGNTTTTNIPSGIPAGYYNAAAGLTCGNLKDALSSIITAGQTTLSYSTLDDNQIPVADVIQSDDGLRSIIWDIYTNNTTGPEPFEYNSSQNPAGGFCGGTGTSGCWNKEHTFPQSWFGSASPTVADLFVVRPTDVNTNSKRMNLPYSIVGGSTTYTFPATTSTYPGVPILDKVGPSTAAGITAPAAFEPANGVKGDLARAYFYILTRYQNNLSGWASANAGSGIEYVVDGVTGGGTYPSFKLPYLTLMYNWHVADPVDAREINYNNLVYTQQNNRNPYIDHPEYVAQVFQCTGVLPVTLIDFTAQKYKETVLLKWYATFEVSFNKYEVERSINGVIFNKIGDVPGQNLANYNFTDNDLPKVTTVYYRLKMVDIDGQFHYSKIVSVKLDNAAANAVVYPNPTAGALNIRLNNVLQANSVLQITDVTGRTMKKLSVNANTAMINTDITNLPAGRYFIKIINDKEVINQSFVKVK